MRCAKSSKLPPTQETRWTARRETTARTFSPSEFFGCVKYFARFPSGCLLKFHTLNGHWPRLCGERASGINLSKGSGPRAQDIIYFYFNDEEAKLLRAELMQRYARRRNIMRFGKTRALLESYSAAAGRRTIVRRTFRPDASSAGFTSSNVIIRPRVF